jgi:hypothetical protein
MARPGQKVRHKRRTKTYDPRAGNSAPTNAPAAENDESGMAFAAMDLLKDFLCSHLLIIFAGLHNTFIIVPTV